VDARAPQVRAVAAERAAQAGKHLARRIADFAETERARIGLWTPVALGAGAVFYFSLTIEPVSWAAPVLGAGLLVAALFARPQLLRLAAAAGFLAAAGFALADLRTEMVRTPIIEEGLGPRLVVGRIVSIEESANGRRILVAVRAVVGVAAPPVRARIAWRGAAFAAGPGDLVRFRAVLRPPPPPETPDGFDYPKLLYFERVGALGYALTPPLRLAEAAPPPNVRVGAAIERLRSAVTQRVLAVAPGQGGALVAASITGDRAAINAETEAALRDSGLAHLIAISGLNMALATGLVFFSLRAALALIPPLALRRPIKKWAAAAALAAGFVYLILSGGAWSAVRAFIMAAIVFLAILFDRRALTLRNVAVAAVIILVLTPEAATQPGFQMSFAAATALVAAYEWGEGRFRPDPHASPLRKLRRYALGLVATDVVASSATGPFSLFHFGRVALFGLPANIAAGPIMAFLLMPFAVLGMALMPLGLDAPAMRAAAIGGDAIIWVGEKVSNLSHGVATVAQGPAVALGLATLGGLWLCMMTRPWRWAGAGLAAFGALLLATARPSDILVSADGARLGVMLRDAGALATYPAEPSRFLERVWKEQVGLDAERASTRALEDEARCILGLCALTLRGARLAIATTAAGADRVCDGASSSVDLVIVLSGARLPQDRACASQLLRAGAGGAAAVRIGANGRIQIKTADDARGVRPWVSPSTSVASEGER
jgi:competence protein ComEC